MINSVLINYLEESRQLILDEIDEIVPRNRYRPVLYDLVLDYPLRGGKAFRPALCIATCRALGGRLEDVLRTAAVLELFHNAFLVHDDIEDGSLIRRGEPTLHRNYGVPIAVNVGDASFVLCLQPLLDNMQLLGLGKAIQILQIVATMARESVEGQAMELDWIRRGQWRLRDLDYYRMCYKKSCWYTFVAPTQMGAAVSGAAPKLLALLHTYARYTGIAFQIQDDALNLIADESRYGKEIGGDLWEGKYTLILLHMMRSATEREVERARCILAKARPDKSAAEVRYLFELIEQYGSIEHARSIALKMASRAERALRQAYEWMPVSVHRDFLAAMVEYVIARDK